MLKRKNPNLKLSLISLIMTAILLFATACSESPDANDIVSSQSISSGNTISEDNSDNIQLDSSNSETSENESSDAEKSDAQWKFDLSEIPEFSGSPFVVLNANQPIFSQEELTDIGFEKYSSLDDLGRCGVVVASLGKETMPRSGEERGSISSVYPTGWKQAKYDNISGKYLYNRCHLIGWQLSAENANKSNLITGTKYINIEGMLPFENMVADYIKETNNHVAYRVVPIFEGNNLVCNGVQIEAQSVEDDGEGICFNVYCYNVQPGINIDYRDGSSRIT